MKKTLFACAALGLATASFAIWPFSGSKESKETAAAIALLDEPNKMLRKATDLEAQGKTDEALALYLTLIGMLNKIEMEKDPNAQKQEFASLRVMKVNCLNAINQLEMKSVSANPERLVSVTATTGLEQQIAKERAERARKAAGLPPETEPETATPAPAAPTAFDQLPPALKAPRPQTTLADDEAWARELWEDGNFDKLDAFLAEALEIHPEAPELMLLLAQLRLAQERYAEAATLGDALAATTPAFTARASLIAAGAYLGMGQHLKAINTLDRVLALHPAQPIGYINMAWILSEMGEKAKPDAIGYYTRAVTLGNPRDPILERRFNMGEPAAQ